MDSEHRHELAENDLARILAGYREKIGGYAGPIVAGVIAVVAIVIGTAVIRSQNDAATQEAWQKLSSAQIPETFADVAENYPGTEVAAWARVNEGRLFLREGIRESFSNRDAATKALQSAKTAFEAALASPVAPPEAKERALFGLATYEETVSDGDTSAAVAAYQRLVNEFPDAASRQYAESRIKVLESDAGQEFYAWFSKQEPKAEASASPLDGFNLDSMSQPPAAIEGLPTARPEGDDGSGEAGGSEEATDAETSVEEPANDDVKMKDESTPPAVSESTDVSETTDASKPDASKPDGEKPDGEKPATEDADTAAASDSKPAEEPAGE